MCFRVGAHLGVPLDKRTPNEVAEDREVFWQNFFEQANQEFNDARDNRSMRSPIVPSPSLRRMHTIAVMEYSEEKRPKMEQLKYMFDWSPVC
jgi:hypothetical protein